MKTHSIAKHLFTIVFLVFTSVSSYAQDDEAYKTWEKHFNLGFQFFETNNFQFAKKHLEKAIPYAEKAEDSIPRANITTKYLYAETLSYLSDYVNSRLYYEESLKIAENFIERDYDFEARIQQNIASLYSSIGDYDTAIAKQNDLIKFIKEKRGEESEYFASAINTLGQFYFNYGDCNEAVKYYNISENLFLKLNITTIDLAVVYNNLGLCYFSKGDYVKANEVYLKALDMSDSLDEMQQLDYHFYSKLLANIAALGQVEGDYENSKLLHEKSLQILSDLKLEDSVEYGEGLFAYGMLLKELGDFEKALSEVLKAKALYDKYLEPTHPKFADVKSTLAEIYLNNGKTKEALKYYEEAADLFKEKTPSTNPGYGYAINGLGTTYQVLGDYEKSLEYYLLAQNYLKVALSESHKDFGIILMNIGQVYLALEDYDTSYKYLEKAIPVLKNSIGTNNTIYAQLCINIMQVTFANPDEKLTEIEFLIDFTLSIFENLNNKDNLFYYRTQFFKANLLIEKGLNKDALNLLIEIEKQISKSIDVNSQMYNDVIFYIGYNYDLLNDYDNATLYFKKYNEFLLRSVSDVFSFRSEKDKKIYLNRLEFWFSVMTSISMQDEYKTQDVVQLSINNQLLRKGLLLNSSKNILSQLATLNENDINLKIDTYRNLKNKINSLKISNETNNDELTTLSSNLNKLETELVELYSKRFKSSVSFNKDWKDIKNKLQPNEVAIEFVSYVNPKAENPNANYIAYIIKNDSENPEVIKLFNEQELKSVISKKTPNQLYSTRGSKGRSVSSTKDLYDVIWKPLESYLNDIETIYFSPVGLLNQVPFAALSSKGELLNDKYSLVQLSSTSLLAESNVEPKQNNTLFIGGIDYEYNKTATVSDNKSSEFNHLSDKRGTRSLGSSWDYLSGTLEEVNAVGKLFKKNNKTYSLFTKQEATEANFKALSGKSPSVMHIATHGFFFENPKAKNYSLETSMELVYKVSEDPLMRSGLILAGANYAWKHGNNPFEKENGILTASEISNLDLSNTDMVVLSACETGLGDIDGSEGVYGLQRAFKMAGVDIIVMSLWEVPDAETSEFMQLFYSNWLRGMKVREAFRNTQRTMSNKYKDTPEKWAAFVLFE